MWSAVGIRPSVQLVFVLLKVGEDVFACFPFIIISFVYSAEAGVPYTLKMLSLVIDGQ